MDVKISDLQSSSTPLSGSEQFPAVQNGTTVKVAVSGVLFNAEETNKKYTNDINVDVLYPLGSGYYTISTAIAAVPSGNLRKIGSTVTFQSASGVFERWQYIGTSTSTWTTTTLWINTKENATIRYAKNNSGGIVAKGKLVYISGSTGENPLFLLATNTDYNIAARTWGMTYESINNNAVGRVINFGMIENIDTSAYTAGTELWLGINGAFTNVRPTSPAFQTSIGMVIRQHATVGSIFVNMRYVNIEGIRSQNTNTSPSSKLLDDTINGINNSIFDEEYSSLFYGHDEDFAGSSLVTDQTWVELNSADKEGIIETFKIPIFTGNNYNAKIVVVGQDLKIKSITNVILSGVTSNLSSYNIEVSIGDYVGFYSSSITSILKYKTLAGCSCASYSTSPNIGDINQGNPTVALNYYYEIKSYSLVSKFEQKLKKLSYNESNSLVITGSSLSESLTTPNGMGWIERLNDIMDIPIVNAAVGGKSLIYNMNMLANNIPLPHDSENTINGCNPQYIMWLNSANGTPIGEDAIKQLRVANMLTKTLGAKMIVGTEEYWPDYDWRHEGKSISFGEMENIPYSTLSKLSKMLYPSYVYPGFEYGNHSGYRAQSVYLAHYENILYSMTPKQAIKAYRVRPLFKGGSPTISELSYNDNIDRWKKYYSISAGNGTNFTPTTGGIDNLDNHTYDVANGVNTGILTTETSVLIRGGAISFNNYALLEFILKDININSATISFNCSTSPDNIYILRKRESSLTETSYTDPATEFENLDFTYSNGIVTILISNNVQCYDKTSILVNKSGSFNIDSPEISYYGGIEKDIYPLKKIERKFGVEQQTYHDMTNGGWTLNGNAVLKSFPTEIAQYPGYNSANSHIELPNDTSFINKNISLTAPCSKLAIRIVAQNFIKIATTRYNDNPTLLNSGYINNSGPQITPYDYDYGELYIKTTRGFLIKKIVMQGWTECYVEIPVYPDDSVIQLEIGRTNHVDSNYSNENSIIMINDISVQKI